MKALMPRAPGPRGRARAGPKKYFAKKTRARARVSGRRAARAAW